MTQHSTTTPTEEERGRLDLLVRLPCLCCYPIGQANRTEVHHIVDHGYRIHSGGHLATLPLCSWHHRGVPRYGWQHQQMLKTYGPSLARTKALFVERYGTERALLAIVDAFAVPIYSIAGEIEVKVTLSRASPWPGIVVIRRFSAAVPAKERPCR